MLPTKTRLTDLYEKHNQGASNIFTATQETASCYLVYVVTLFPKADPSLLFRLRNNEVIYTVIALHDNTNAVLEVGKVGQAGSSRRRQGDLGSNFLDQSG